MDLDRFKLVCQCRGGGGLPGNRRRPSQGRPGRLAILGTESEKSEGSSCLKGGEAQRGPQCDLTGQCRRKSSGRFQEAEPQGQSSEKPQQATLAAVEEEGNGDSRKGRRTEPKCRTGA